jgi:hypothetical protein
LNGGIQEKGFSSRVWKGKEHVKKTKDIEDIGEVYVKVPSHQNIPPFNGFIATKELAPSKAFFKCNHNQMSQQ